MSGTTRFFSGKGNVPLALFFVLGFFIYAPAMHGPFIFDDVGTISENRHIHIHIQSLGIQDLWQAAFSGRLPTRPVPKITFALNYFFHAKNTFGYHLTNVLIHITTALILYFLLRATLALPAARQGKEPDSLAPFFAALIWLVHPVATQSVSYIVQRMNSMSAMFYVAALLLYIKARTTKKQNRILFVCCAFLFFLALGSKEIALTFPVMVILYEWFFFQDMSWVWVRRRAYWFAGVIAACVVLVLFYTDFHPIGWILDFYIDEQRSFSLGERMLTQFRVVFFYIGLLFFPRLSSMNLDHDFLVSTGFLSPPATLACALLIAALIGWAVLRARKERLLSFCILWFFGNLIIESTVVGLEMVFEHRLYLPSMFIASGFVYVLPRIVKNRRAVIGVLCAVVALLCVATYQRNFVWADHIVFWADCVEKSPEKARPNYNMGRVLHEDGRLDEAVNYYKKALAINPELCEAHSLYGLVLAKQGKLSQALPHLFKAIEIKPGHSPVYVNVGLAFFAAKKFDEAWPFLAKAVALDPLSGRANLVYADFLLKIDRPAQAIPYYLNAINAMPLEGRACHNLARAYRKTNKLGEALFYAQMAVKIMPDNSRSHNELGQLLVKAGDFEQGMSHLKKAIALNPENKKAYNNAGSSCLAADRIDEAKSYLLSALALDPDYREARINLAIVMARKGEIKPAMALIKEILAAHPDDVYARFNLSRMLIIAGKKAEAEFHLNRVLELDPEFGPAKKALDKIRKAGKNE